MTESTINPILAARLAAAKKPETTPEAKSLVVAEKFQEYKSARPAMRLITTGGIRISFTGFKLLTQTKEVIEYLDAEIAKGLPGITKGKLLTLDEVNPMQTLRREIEAELREKLANEAADSARGITRAMGETERNAHINPAGSNVVAT